MALKTEVIWLKLMLPAFEGVSYQYQIFITFFTPCIMQIIFNILRHAMIVVSDGDRTGPLC